MFQLFQSRIRLSQPQPQFGALDKEGELVGSDWVRRVGFDRGGIGFGRWSGSAYFDVHASDYGRAGWTKAVQLKVVVGD